VFIIYLVKFSFLFFFYLFATDCVFSVNKDYQNEINGVIFGKLWLLPVNDPTKVGMNRAAIADSWPFSRYC